MGTPFLLTGLGLRIRRARTARGLSQKQLCEAAGISPRFMVQLEAGSANVSLARLADVAAALDQSLVSLLAGLGPQSDAPDLLAEAALHLDPQQRRELLERAGARTRKLALIGLRGAGKTTIGRRAAQELGCPFVVLDQRVEERAGMTLVELFEYHGGERYREIRQAVLAELLSEPGPAIIEVGGSLVTEPDAYDLLMAQSTVTWLYAAPEDYLQRVRDQGDTRPMAGRTDPLGEIREILARREPQHAKAHHRVDTAALGLDGAVQAVVSAHARDD